MPWRRTATAETFNAQTRLSPKANEQVAQLKELVNTLLPAHLKTALSPLLSQAMRELMKSEENVAQTVERLYAIADAFRAIDAKYPEEGKS
jgi:regulator of sirC expression with transglutaminase-like and TPR domain